mmetsp:Transcript_42246/g.106429  ORF Transcript_42246/g.106429 Transcript_42246/m.106429 type:complete len:214 (-) Transcript_42246:78-719(-)
MATGPCSSEQPPRRCRHRRRRRWRKRRTSSRRPPLRGPCELLALLGGSKNARMIAAPWRHGHWAPPHRHRRGSPRSGGGCCRRCHPRCCRRQTAHRYAGARLLRQPARPLCQKWSCTLGQREPPNLWIGHVGPARRWQLSSVAKWQSMQRESCCSNSSRQTDQMVMRNRQRPPLRGTTPSRHLCSPAACGAARCPSGDQRSPGARGRTRTPPV